MSQLSRIMLLAVCSLFSACGNSQIASTDAQPGGGSRVVPFAPTPDADPFYAQPAEFPNDTPGTILESREIAFAPGGVPTPTTAWQLKFVSRDTYDQPIAAVTTVIQPTTATNAMMVYLVAEDGLGSHCAPSHTAPSDTDSAPLLGVAMGWTVVIPDHEGPNSAYAAGKIAGQITLDSVRAALNFQALGLNEQTQLGLLGYSGGAIAAAWAATLAPDYAPELAFAGIASGGTPADLIGIARHADTDPIANSAFFSLILSSTVGINREYPQLLTPILNDKGKAAFEQMKDNCLNDNLLLTTSIRGSYADYVTVPDIYASAGLQEVQPLISLPQPGQSPNSDIFVFHSKLDELIPIAGTDQMVAAWCADGAPVHYYRGQEGEHASFGSVMIPVAIQYLQSRFAGEAASVPLTTERCN